MNLSAAAGHATPQQPLRPSFMDYFDKQDSNKAAQQQENYNHNQPQEQPGYHIQSKNVFPDNWKVPQDGDFDFVSTVSPSSGSQRCASSEVCHLTNRLGLCCVSLSS